MAQNSKVVDGIHLVKAGGFGSPRVGIPEELADQVKISNGVFVGVMVVGECVVLCPVKYVTRDGMPEEMAAKFTKAMAEWKARDKAVKP